MDRRQFRKTEDNIKSTLRTNAPSYKLDNDVKDAAGQDRRLSALRELGNHLQVKAEKMRLLVRAEEGLGDGDFNPYTTMTVSPENIPIPKKSILEYLPNEGNQDSKIPVSNARRRRRDKKIKGGNQPTVDIRQYRPGYTWNRGGRMKEIRIRYLARKFLHMWKKKIFGRVTPSQARSHYRRRLLKITFGAWYDMWWEVRKEWRLEVRAECHHRYMVWLKTFRAWKDFIIRQRIKNTKLALAEQHASCKLTRRCVDAWIVYVDFQRGKNKKKQAAEEHHDHMVLRVFWQKWVSKHDLVLHRQHMESVALQFWAYRIQAQHWLIWQERMSQRRAGIVNQYRAVRHHNVALARQCFQAWTVYWCRRRQKKQEKEYSMLVYQKCLLQKSWRQWVDTYNFRQAMLQQQENIVSLAEQFQKRRMFLHWKHYIHMVKEQQDMVIEADSHYMRKLMIAGLSGFRLCVVQRKIKVMRHEMADQLRYKQLTRMVWTRWLVRCENNEELKIIAQSQVARKHFRLRLLRKCLAQLHQYCLWRQHRQAQYVRADAHYYMQVMPEYMFQLKVFVQLMKNNRENAENAIQFRRENAQARFFYVWVNQFEFSKEYRMNERMAILHCDQIKLKRFFTSWKQKTAASILNAENEEIACEHYQQTLCRSHLLAWKGYILYLKQSQRKEIEACKHHRKTLVNKCLQAWLKYTGERREKFRKTMRARQHYVKVVTKKMLSMWLHYVDMQRCIKQRAEVMYTRKCSQRLGELFVTWRANVAAQVLERQDEDQACNHYSHHILAKVFKSWHRYAAIHAYKKSETRKWVVSAQEHLNLKLLEVYFTKWKTNHKEHVCMRLKYDLAAHHHGDMVKQQVMTCWKQYTQESVRQNLLQKQSDWFQNVRLTARYFIAWKHAHVASLVQKEKTDLALWHWCLNLHKRVLIGWYNYTQERKHKKARVHEALERRRCRLLKDGLTQWLTAADDMSAMRKTFAAQQQAKSAYETYQLVLRCGLHWKHWASKKRDIRGEPKPRGTPTATPRTMSSISAQQPVLRLVKSATTTPVVSTANTGKELTAQHQISPRQHVKLPAPVVSASPAREKLSIPRVGRAELSVQPQLRARPRRPDFLVESLKRAGLFSVAAQSPDKVASNLFSDHQENNTNNAKPPERGETEAEVERLNLSGLSSNRTDTDSVPFKPYSYRDGNETVPNSGKSDQTLHIDSRPQSGSCREPSQTDNEKITGPVHLVLSPGGYASEIREEIHSSAVMYLNDPSSVDKYVPKPLSKHLQLMTPADFCRKDEKTMSHEQRLGGFDSKSVTPRSVQEPNTAYSECQSVASTPRVMCQSSEHSHPLYETYSFKVGDFKGEITPRSTTSHVTQNDQLSSLGFEPSSLASTQDVQKEIVVIRNRLKSFDLKKKKLRKMQKQLKQLCDWLKDIEVKGHGSDDEDVVNAKQEVQELSADVTDLKTSVEHDKAQCTGLVDRVKVLMTQLTT